MALSDLEGYTWGVLSRPQTCLPHGALQVWGYVICGLVPRSGCLGQRGSRCPASMPPACQAPDVSGSSVLDVGQVSALGLGLFSSGLSC